MPTGGSVILQTPISMLGIYPRTYKKLPHASVVDVVPRSLGATFDFGFAVGASVPVSVRTMEDFLAWFTPRALRKRPGSIHVC